VRILFQALQLHRVEFMLIGGDYSYRARAGHMQCQCQGPMDKANILENLLLDRAADSGDGSAPCVYVGDSIGDLAALLSADVAIALGANPRLRSAFDAFGCVLHPIAEMTMATASQPPGHMIEAAGWDEVFRLLFAEQPLPPPTSGPLFERRPSVVAAAAEAARAAVAAMPDSMDAAAAALPAATAITGNARQASGLPRVLVIAGSDSGGGAGIQADVRTCMACGAYAATAITALTAQNTRGVQAVHVPPVAILAAQIRSVLDDIGADVIKTGMLPDVAAVRAVAAAVRTASGTGAVQLVVDPVMVATSGDSLADTEVAAALKTDLIPLATVITPNLIEAAALLGAGLPVSLKLMQKHPA
jgi:Phosphomethylpyrimidine kinase